MRSRKAFEPLIATQSRLLFGQKKKDRNYERIHKKIKQLSCFEDDGVKKRTKHETKIFLFCENYYKQSVGAHAFCGISLFLFYSWRTDTASSWSTSKPSLPLEHPSFCTVTNAVITTWRRRSQTQAPTVTVVRKVGKRRTAAVGNSNAYKHW